MRYDFGSDNTAGMAPAALQALIAANEGYARAYGADDITARAADQIRQRLDADAEVRFVFSGTAANSIALSMLAWPHEAVLAHHAAHICTDETGAPGFFGQGVGLIGLPGLSGKIEQKALEAALEEPEVGHRQPAAALSLTQSTEYGTVYTEEELRHLIEPVKARGFGVHMDGARLANAAAAGFDLTQIARLGVDVLVFGGAKAGGLCTEAIVMFDKSLARRVENRLKQAGQTASKGRFLAAPLLGMLEANAWEYGAAHANLMAQRLAAGIATRSRFVLAHPVEANAVFVRMPAMAHAKLNELGWACYRFDDGSVRFVCSWATEEAVVDEVIEAIAGLS
ncbi:beta-eliminating lyase-related protein [Brevundimonas sp. NIBR11]|uniref:threonine aldolase family protein n=1 Tax=Brevundimonas sp. NIBR11 TaxID=3015999 RepID=UPI0022F0C44F|nr:beta-eliminating lyase-related protein [Brevundimonas sp. NIBR11]WGM31349.1 Low specificity L-threonine aldolase [Brevundimonas sp. NIBR11]